MMKRREREIRQRIEERALARKLMAEQRRNTDKHGAEHQAKKHKTHKKRR